MKFYESANLSLKQMAIRGTVASLLLILFLLAIYLPLKLTGALSTITSPLDLKNLILSGGGWSLLLFAVIQFLQVTFIPLPAIITTTVGTLIFGPWITLLISTIAVMAGSIFAFWLGRKFGRTLLFWVTGERKGRVLINKVSKGKYLFFLMMLFPFFPDDVLCIVAGVTKMSYSFFIVTNIICRPLALLPICFMGSGEIIPFTGWGIPVWIVLGGIMLTLFFLSVRYQPQIEKKLSRFALIREVGMAEFNKRPSVIIKKRYYKLQAMKIKST